MFRFLQATTAAERMAELERFIEWWYGPRRPEYGIPEGDLYGVPDPLRRFYAFAGRWPSPEPGGEEHFYTGSAGHHLHPFDMVAGRPDRKVLFFMEYQGDWDGFTLDAGEDPPVWIEGHWDGGDNPDGGVDWERPARSEQVSDSLSKFLVTHVLMTTAYESGNSAARRPDGVSGVITPGEATRIWSLDGCLCPNYDEGDFHLLEAGALVHQIGNRFQEVAYRPWAET